MRTMMVLIVGLSLAAKPALADRHWSLNDLQALDKQHAWQELFDHLGDIPPASRDATWQAMLERASLALLQDLDARASDAATFADTVTRQYPQIKTSKSFMALRAEVGIRSLETCVKTARIADVSACADAFVAYASADGGNPDLAWRAGEVIVPKDGVAALPFLKRGLGTSKDVKACSDDGLKVAVVATLGLKPKDPHIADAQLIADQLCWDALKESLVEGFTKGSGDYRRNTCGFLKVRKNILSPLSIRECDALK